MITTLGRLGTRSSVLVDYVVIQQIMFAKIPLVACRVRFV